MNFRCTIQASATRTIAGGVRTRTFSPTTPSLLAPPAAGCAPPSCLAIIDLPLIFIDLQVIAGNNPPGGQVTFITTHTYLFLAGTAVLYVAVLARRASPPASSPTRSRW
ncbi:hypothetical protein [Methanoculleus chikugoensis]|uniref:hypothetical protein n=1 Tax=Methanoculleus chikugoensis TaxID=118126 RepID=UPI000A9F9CB0|nr:hypothetical protein [Methanoculleus chikugoensis]